MESKLEFKDEVYMKLFQPGILVLDGMEGGIKKSREIISVNNDEERKRVLREVIFTIIVRQVQLNV